MFVEKRFAESHEWVEMESDKVAVVGISEYAAKELVSDIMDDTID